MRRVISKRLVIGMQIGSYFESHFDDVTDFSTIEGMAAVHFNGSRNAMDDPDLRSKPVGRSQQCYRFANGREEARRDISEHVLSAARDSAGSFDGGVASTVLSGNAIREPDFEPASCARGPFGPTDPVEHGTNGLVPAPWLSHRGQRCLVADGNRTEIPASALHPLTTKRANRNLIRRPRAREGYADQ